jgi:hypothetical protein
MASCHGCADTEDTCVRLNWMVQQLVRRVKTGILAVFLDACRQNEADITFKARGVSGAGAGDATGARRRRGLSSHVDVRRDR